MGAVRAERRGLYAKPRQVDAAFAEMVREGKFRKVSASFYGPDHPDSPAPESWYLRHVGFLGAKPPVVKGLDQVEFADDDSNVEIELAEMSPWAMRSIASLFRGLREHLIASSGTEVADKAMPDWEIDHLATEAGRMEESAPSVSYSEPDDPAPTSTEDEPVSGPTAAELAAKEAELAERESAIEARETAAADRAKTARKADAVQFAEKLAADGKVLPRDQGAIADLLMTVPEDATIEFAEDADATPAPGKAGTFLRTFLERLPKQVDFSERAPTPGAPTPAPAMKIPSGYSMAPENAELHRRAVEFAERENVDYDTAIVRVAQGA